MVGNGQSLPMTHLSSGILHTTHYSFKLLDLLRVSHISSDLLFVNHLFADNKCVIIFNYDFFLIQDKSSSKILFQGPNINGLYPITPIEHSKSVNTSSQRLVAHVGTHTSTSVFHNRFDHTSDLILHIVLKLMNLSTTSKCICYPCLQGKLHKLPFPCFASTSLHPLELLHIDVWESSPEVSVNGFNYYVYLLDDMSDFTCLFFITHKLMYRISLRPLNLLLKTCCMPG